MQEPRPLNAGDKQAEFPPLPHQKTLPLKVTGP